MKFYINTNPTPVSTHIEQLGPRPEPRITKYGGVQTVYRLKGPTFSILGPVLERLPESELVNRHLSP